MDDFLKVRFALDNVHPRELGENAHRAFDRILSGEAVADPDSADASKYRNLRGPRMRSFERATSVPASRSSAPAA